MFLPKPNFYVLLSSVNLCVIMLILIVLSSPIFELINCAIKGIFCCLEGFLLYGILISV
jgi:hypothetical protein